MTHDELLISVSNSFEKRLKKTLRVVVELHTPTPEGRYPKLLCQGCSMTEVNLYVDYPCLTIQAMEKELK